MSYEKLPFKEYTVMSNQFIQVLSVSDVYRTFVLLLTADKAKLKTDTTLEQLALFVGESKYNYENGSRSKSFIDKLRATNEVDITHKQIDSFKHQTVYTFKDVTHGNYRRISRSFYDNYNKTLDLKIRGFLIKLFSAAEPHSLSVKMSINKLSKTINMGHATISKYLKAVETEGLIDWQNGEIKLKVEGFLIDKPRDKKSEAIIKELDALIKSRTDANSPLTRELHIYQKYRNKKFEGINNLPNFLHSIQTGLIGRSKSDSERENTLIIL